MCKIILVDPRSKLQTEWTNAPGDSGTVAWFIEYNTTEIG